MGTTLTDSLSKAIQGMTVDPIVQYSPGTPTNQDAQVAVNQMVKRRKVRVGLTDSGTAATAVTEKGVFVCDGVVQAGGLKNGIRIISAYLTFPIAVTADATNIATFTLAKRTSGGSAVTVASVSTVTSDPVLGSNAAAFTAYAMTNSATAANLLLAGGTDVLTIKVVKGASGVAIAASTSDVLLDIVYEEY